MNPFYINVPEMLEKHPRKEHLICLREFSYEDFRIIGEQVSRETSSLLTEKDVLNALHACADEFRKKPREIEELPSAERLDVFKRHLKIVVLKSMKRKPW